VSFDPQLCLSTILPLAEAAYQATPVLPEGWRLIQTIQPGDMGYFAVNGDMACLAFRGTEHEQEWLSDFDAAIVPNLYGDGFVHRGFQAWYTGLRPRLVSIAAAVDPAQFKRVFFIGHSAGGALAPFAASDLFRHLGKVAEGYTFEAPRCGWFNWAGYFDRNISVWWRIENHWDIVPHAPPDGLGYRHVGTQILVDPGYVPDAHVNHSLAQVRAGLKKLIG